MFFKKYMVGMFFCVVVFLYCAVGYVGQMRQYAQSDATYHIFAEQSQEIESTTDWETIRTQFPDLVGILHGTGVWYPVVQGMDNEYYLHHMADGTKNELGAIFLDATHKSDFSSPISVLYGHDVTQHRMFGFLQQYREQSFYEQYPVLYLDTPQQKYNIVLLGCILLDGSQDTYPTAFESPQQMQQYLNDVQQRSFFETAQTATNEERLLILSTCANDFDNARLAVIGKLEM